MSEIKVTDAITVKNPEQRVETADPIHSLITAEAQKILDNPFVQEKVGTLPVTSTNFKLEVTLGGAKITLGARVVEDLTSQKPTADLAPFKKEYIESCNKIMALLDLNRETSPATEALDLATNHEQAEAKRSALDFLDLATAKKPAEIKKPSLKIHSEDLQQKVNDLEEIHEAQQGLFSQMEAEIDRLLQSASEDSSLLAEFTSANQNLNEENEKLKHTNAKLEALLERKEIPTSANQTFKFTSLDEEASLEEAIDGISGMYQEQIAALDETISHLREEISQLREAQSDSPQPTEKLVASDGEHPLAYLGLQDGELDHLFENDDLPSQEELEIALLQERIDTLQQQNAEAVQTHGKLQQDLIAALQLQKVLNHDLQGSLDNARYTLKEVLAEKQQHRLSFALPQLREQLRNAEAELEKLRQQQFVIPESTSPRSSSVERKLQAALEKAQSEVDSMREEIERQAEKFETQIRQQKETIAQLKEDLQRSEAGRLHYENIVRSRGA